MEKKKLLQHKVATGGYDTAEEGENCPMTSPYDFFIGGVYFGNIKRHCGRLLRKSDSAVFSTYVLKNWLMIDILRYYNLKLQQFFDNTRRLTIKKPDLKTMSIKSLKRQY